MQSNFLKFETLSRAVISTVSVLFLASCTAAPPQAPVEEKAPTTATTTSGPQDSEQLSPEDGQIPFDRPKTGSADNGDYAQQGEALFHQEKYKEAADAFSKAIDANGNAANHNWRGNSYNKLRLYDKAASDFTESIRLEPDNSYSYFERARSWFCQHDYDKALQDLKKFIALEPNEAKGYFFRGTVYTKQKNYKRAVADFQRQVRLQPKHPLGYCNLAYNQWKLNDDQAALRSWDKASQLDPKDASNYINRSAVYYKERKYQEAYDMADRAIKIAPTCAPAICNRGEASLKLKHYQAALDDFDKCVEMVSDGFGGEAYYYRAQAYTNLGQAEAAAKDAARAMKYNFEPQT
jgi:tetratricopeptide (TPR) repeat protein